MDLPTPTSYIAYDKACLTRYSLLQIALGQTFGDVRGLPDQRDGALSQDIYPAKNYEDRPSSSFGSLEKFEYHTDQAYNSDPLMVPSAVLLGCVRNDEHAATTGSSLREIYHQLTASESDLLASTQYRFYRGRVDEGHNYWSGPVLLDSGNSVRIGTDMACDNTEADAALTRFRQLAADSALKVVLEPGQTLVTPNHTIVHARDAFVPNYNVDKRRWLHRIDVFSVAA